MDEAQPIERTVVTNSPGATRELARALARRVTRPAVIGLVGPLGAGKTEFVKGLGEGLGLDPRDIHSPTFVIAIEYGEHPTLIHVDAYRLRSGAELEAIGFDEMLRREDALIAVEWADRVADIMPPETLWATHEITGPTQRTIHLRAAPTDDST